ncbi:MAG: VCBS repeat-containing protein, partial [Tepidisphaeraceae bacterium]
MPMMPIRLARRFAAKSSIRAGLNPIAKKGRLKGVASRDLALAVIETLEKRAYLSGVTFLGTKGGLALDDLGSFSAPGGVGAIAAADFNGDGKTDLVTATVNGTVGISLGNGDGTFGPVNSFSDGLDVGDIASVVVANLNGFPDIIAADGTNKISILLNSGTGTFPNISQITFERNIDALAVGDLTGDGKPDLVVGYQFGGIAVLLNNGTGGFNSPSFYSVGDCTVTSLSIADVKGDNRPDIIIGDANGGIYDLGQQESPGTFNSEAAQVYFDSSNTNPQVATGDLNGDGYSDIAFTTPSGVMTALSQGSDGFQEPVNVLEATGITSIALAHMGGDGNLDLVVGNSQTSTVRVLLGNGDGTFTSEYSKTVAAGSEPVGIVAAQFTGDGRTDLGVVNQGSNNVTVVLNTSAGVVFNPATNLTTENGADSVAVADVNNDGNMDVIVADEQAGTVQVFLGEGDG